MLKADLLTLYGSENKAAQEIGKRLVKRGLNPITRQAINQWDKIVPQRSAQLIAMVEKRLELRPQDYAPANA